MSAVEDLLNFQLETLPLTIKREFKAIPGRNYRFDFALSNEPCELLERFVPICILLEVQGGIWKKMGHSTGTGITRDCEKFSLAAIQGYRIILATPAQVKSGECYQWVRNIFGLHDDYPSLGNRKFLRNELK